MEQEISKSQGPKKALRKDATPLGRAGVPLFLTLASAMPDLRGLGCGTIDHDLTLSIYPCVWLSCMNQQQP